MLLSVISLSRLGRLHSQPRLEGTPVRSKLSSEIRRSMSAWRSSDDDVEGRDGEEDEEKRKNGDSVGGRHFF